MAGSASAPAPTVLPVMSATAPSTVPSSLASSTASRSRAGLCLSRVSYQNARSWARRLEDVFISSPRRRRDVVGSAVDRPWKEIAPRRTKRRAARLARRPGSGSCPPRRAARTRGRAGRRRPRLRAGGERSRRASSRRARPPSGATRVRDRLAADGGWGRRSDAPRGEVARRRAAPGARRTRRACRGRASDVTRSGNLRGVRTRVAWRGVLAAPRERPPRSRDASNLQRFPAKRTQGAESATRSRVTDGRVFPTRPKEIPQRTTRTLPARFFAEMMTAEIATDSAGAARGRWLSQRAHFENRCFRCLGETRGGRVVSARARTSRLVHPSRGFRHPPPRTMGVPSFNSFDERTRGSPDLGADQHVQAQPRREVDGGHQAGAPRARRARWARRPRAPRSTSSARCARRRAASTT